MNISISIQGIDLQVYFLPFHLGDTRLILGMAWLMLIGWTHIH